MKKLMVITDLYPHKHNVANGVFVQHQLSELSKHYQVFVVATCDKYPYEYEFSMENSIKVSRVYYPYWQKYFLSALFTYPFLALPKIITSYLRWKPDLVQVHDYRHVPELVWLNLFLLIIRKPRYLTLHNIRTHPQRLGNNPLRWFYRQGLALALSSWTHIFTVNQRLASWVYPHGYDNNSVTVLGNGVQPFTSSLPSDPHILSLVPSAKFFRIISVGNLVPEKGFEFLIEAIALLRSKSMDIKLTIVGDGPEKVKLMKLVGRHDLLDNVHFAGILSNEQVRALYPRYDAFVLPSYSETFGIVYIEAMYAGIPIIGVTGEGISGLFEDGIEALFSKPKDIQDLAEKILLLIRNEDFRYKLATAGQTKVRQRYMLNTLVENMVRVYER